MNWDVFITCAITGAGATTGKSEKVPVTPEHIADSAIEAAKAGAAVVHLHVRNPNTGAGSRDVALYREAVDRIRSSGTDAVINLTAGMGGDLVLGQPEQPLPFKIPGTDMVGATERLAHVTELLPEICTLDCGTMNFGSSIAVNRVSDLEVMARIAQQLGVKPELEVFDLGQIQIARHLIAAGLVDGTPLFQLCLGINWGAPATTEAMLAMRDALPSGSNWAAFAISRAEFPMVAQAALLGGNCRVGLEDNLYLGKGELASNGQLVQRACRILDSIGVAVMSPAEARSYLGLQKRW